MLRGAPHSLQSDIIEGKRSLTCNTNVKKSVVAWLPQCSLVACSMLESG
jgi:hypothetical protein